MITRDISYKYEFKKSIFWAVIELAMGIALCFIPLERASSFFITLFGIYLLVLSIPRLLIYSKIKDRYGYFMLYSSIAYLILGLLLIIFNTTVINIICACFLIAIPTIRILMSPNKLDALKNEALTLIVGLAVILFGFEGILKVARYIVAGIVILFAIINAVMAFIEYRKSRNQDNILDAEIRELN